MRSPAHAATRTSATGRTDATAHSTRTIMNDTPPPPHDETPASRRRNSAKWLLVATIGAAVVTLGLAALLTNIFERRVEARNPYVRVVEITDTTEDPAVWGRNWPIH